MSAKTVTLKKVRREVRKSKTQLMNSIAKELLTLPLKERIKLSIKIIFKGKL
jgi:hypothetical protein